MISKVRLCLPWTKQVFTIPRYCSPVSAAKSYTTSEGVKDNVIPIPKSADVVIIGGGVIGCSVLYHLTKLGVTNCVLIEKDQLTAGTTWHTNGLVWRLRPNDTDVQLLARSRDLMKSLEAETGVSTGWIENGGMFIASDKERLEEYKQMMSLGKYFGIESHILSPEETKKAFPLMNTEDLYGVLFSPGDGIIDPTGYCTAMARAANQAGAKIITDSYVTDVNVSEDDFGVKRVVSVETSSGKVQTNKVVNCTGVWAPLIGQMAGVKTPLVAMKHAHVVTEKIEGIRNMPNVRDHDASMCLKVQGDTVSIGGYEPNPLFWDDVKKDFAFTLFDLDWDVFGVSIDGAANRVPVVGETGIKATVCGPESFTPDHKPLLGESPEVRGFYHGCGFNSSGMMLSGGCGQQLAEWVAHGSPSLDMYNYDIRRFTEKLTGNQSWMRQRSHEAYATNYSTVFIHDEPLASRNMRLDPLYEELASAGCHYQERQGWERPGWFSDQGPVKPPPYDWYGAYGHPVNQNNSYYDLLKNDYTFGFPAHHDVIGRECLSCRNNVAVFNISYFGKFYLTGPDAQKAADWIFSNDVQKPPGSAVYTCMLNKFGGIESDMTVCVIEPGDGKPHSPTFEGRGFYISVSGATTQHNLSHIINVLQDENFDCQLLDVSEDMGMLSVQGPKSRDVIQALTDGDLSNDAFPFSTNKILSVAGHEVRAVRHSFVGELGWDLLIPKDECVDVYRAVMAEGEQHSIVNAGYRAFDSLSIEKGYRQWHADIRPDDSPLEAGLLHTCKLKTNTSFLGREAVERMQAEGVKKRLACFSIDEHVPLFGLEAIFRDNQVVGYLRRGEYAFSLGQSLGYGYVTHPEGQTVSMDFLKSGEFTIERMGTAYPAALHTKSPFDPKDLRVQGVYTR